MNDSAFMEGWDAFNDEIELRGDEDCDFVEGWLASECYHLDSPDLKDYEIEEETEETSSIEIPSENEIDKWFADLD